MPSKYFAGSDGEVRNSVLGGIKHEDWIQRGCAEGNLSFYLPVSEQKVQNIGLEVHHFGFYHLWRPQDYYYYTVENSGFEAIPVRTEGTFSKYASLNDKIDGFHYFTTYIKFGIGRATFEAAQEIRNGHISREEGVALVQKYDGEFPSKYFADFLQYCKISEDEFWQVIDNNRSPHLWDRNDDGWDLRFKVWERVDP